MRVCVHVTEHANMRTCTRQYTTVQVVGIHLAAAFANGDLVLLADHPLGVDLVTNSMDLQQGGVTCVSFWVGGDGSDWIQAPRAKGWLRAKG